MTKQDLDEIIKNLKIDQLIGLGEAKRIIYDEFPKDKELQEAYVLHQQEMELLIKYQKNLQ